MEHRHHLEQICLLQLHATALPYCVLIQWLHRVWYPIVYSWNQLIVGMKRKQFKQFLCVPISYYKMALTYDYPSIVHTIHTLHYSAVIN